MSKFRRYILIFVVLVVVTYFFFGHDFNSPSQLFVAEPSPSATLIDKSYTFNHVGNFKMSDPKFRRKEYYILYQSFDSVLHSSRLYFDSRSLCGQIENLTECDPSTYEDERRIQVFGIKSGNYVIVRKLIEL